MKKKCMPQGKRLGEKEVILIMEFRNHGSSYVLSTLDNFDMIGSLNLYMNWPWNCLTRKVQEVECQYQVQIVSQGQAYRQYHHH